MKKNIRVVLVIVLFMIALIIILLCIKPTLKFKETEEYLYIEKNKNDVSQFVVEIDNLSGKHCYEINKKDALEVLEEFEIKKETKISVTDSDMYYKIYFNDETVKTFEFEGGHLVYNNKKYELKNSSEIFVLSTDNEIDCR